MVRSIYISSSEPYAGKTLVALGCFEMVLRHTKNVAVFKPIVRDDETGHRDKNVELIIDYHQLRQKYESAWVFYRSEVEDLLAHEKNDEVIDKIIAKYKALEEEYDFIICEGSDFIGNSTAFEFDINAAIAKHLGIPVLVLGQGLGREMEEILNPIQLAIQSYQSHHCKVIGTIVNKVNPDRVDKVVKALKKELPPDTGFVSAIPCDETLKSPTVREVAEQLNAKILLGEDQLDNLVHSFQTVAMRLSSYFKYMKDGAMSITPGDRVDILIGAMMANMSSKAAHVPGILLTGGLIPPKEVFDVISGNPHPIPVLAVDTFTYETTVNAEKVRSTIDSKSPEKIALSLELFEKYVDTDAFSHEVIHFKVEGMTPKMFLYHLRKLASRERKTIVLPEGNDLRILKAIEILQRLDIIDFVVLGNPAEIKLLAQNHGLVINFKKVKIIEPARSKQKVKYAKELHRLRKHKGVTLDIANDLITDVSYFGTMMVHLGDADGMVSGAAHTTMHTIRPALQIIKTIEGFSTVSSVFFMLLEDRVVAYGDCAINPDPNAEQLAEIAIASADTSKRFGVEPRIAMLSYSSGDSGKGADVEKVREATAIVKMRRPDLLVEGPIQYDAAVDPDVAAKKLPGSEVAGHATVLIFPDLNTGNNTYKAVQRETGALAVGPVLQGLRKPVNDLSRGCLVEDVVNTIIITAIQAQSK